MSLKVLERNTPEATRSSAASETMILSEAHAGLLERMSHEINPDMPAAFGWPHAIRLILDHFEENGIDLSAASNEEEIAMLAAARLRAATSISVTDPLCASESNRSAARPMYRSNPLATGRRRSGKPPRSGRG